MTSALRRDFDACLDIGPEAFFPDASDHASARAAKAVCATCLVTSECLNFAFLIGTDYGIWARLTAEERRVLLRRERRGAAALAVAAAGGYWGSRSRAGGSTPTVLSTVATKSLLALV